MSGEGRLEGDIGSGYGYSGALEALRKAQFSRLDRKNDPVTYLDHAGATLQGEGQVRAAMLESCSDVFANPHSQSAASIRTRRAMEEARALVLAHVGADPAKYRVIFTSGATAALKLLGECFPWGPGSEFCHTLDNHNSALGIREYARASGAAVRCIDEESPDKTLSLAPGRAPESERGDSGKVGGVSIPAAPSLFVMPAESNFTGVKHDLALVHDVRSARVPWLPQARADDRVDGKRCSGRWYVCLDAAKFCATDALSLRDFPADFVSISLYKIFGYPTGLGALIARTDAGNILRKRYFGGGTVQASVGAGLFWRERKDLSERLEDGTVPFLAIIAAKHGFAVLRRLGGMRAVCAHVGALAAYLRAKMEKMRHGNGQPLCTIYGGGYKRSVPASKRGGILSFNVLDASGAYVSASAVERLAGAFGFQIRTGCFCNPGACQRALGLSAQDVKANLDKGHVCWDGNDLANGRPTGAIRVSLGYMSTRAEADRWISFLREHFVILDTPEAEQTAKRKATQTSAVAVTRVVVYPVKSCAGFEVSAWPVGSMGLRWDREWAVVNPRGVALTQKRNPRMSLVTTRIDMDKGVLVLEAPGTGRPLIVPLARTTGGAGDDPQNTSICATKCRTTVWRSASSSQKPEEWLTAALGTPCSLVRIASGESRRVSRPRRAPPPEAITTKTSTAQVAFANEGQFLMISESSVAAVRERVNAQAVPTKSAAASNAVSPVTFQRFRPNLVVAGSHAFAEDTWTSVKFETKGDWKKSLRLSVVGPCVRCGMVNIDQRTSVSDRGRASVLRALAKFRKKQNRIVFGVLLAQETPADGAWIRVGDRVVPTLPTIS